MRKHQPNPDERVDGTWLFRISYLVGMMAIRAVKNYARIFWRKTKPIRDFFVKVGKWTLPFWRIVGGEIESIVGHVIAAFQWIRRTAKTDPKRLPQVLLAIPKRAYQTHKPLAQGILNIAMPLLALAILFNTVQYWRSIHYALSVEYGGEVIGYIADESVYDAAVEIAAGRIVNVDDSFQIQRTPKLTVAMASTADLMDENETCDAILRTAGGSVVEACGLYIDGKFTTAVGSEVTINRILKEILKKYEPEEDNERAEFLPQVEIVEGLYPAETVITAFTLRDMLTATSEQADEYEVQKGDTFAKIAKRYWMETEDLQELNEDVKRLKVGETITVIKQTPFLQVKIVRTEEYDEKVPYDTEYIEDKKHYLGYEQVKVSGREGERTVVAEIDLVDGVEYNRTVIESHVTIEPVDRVVIVGAKMYSEGAIIGDGISTGKFVWPLPGCKNIYSDFGWRDGSYHSGIDVSNGRTNGLPIIASDGGRVVAINNTGRGSYGMYVLIDHGGGYETMYAHCSKVLVSVGQKVAQGEVIARVGNTGRSTGPHLHFEIRVNGKHVDPKPFVKSKK